MVPKGYKFKNRKSPEPFSDEHRKKIALGHLGKPSGMLGKKMTGRRKLGWKLSTEARKKISNALREKYSEDQSWLWKGEKVGYMALHTWIRKKLGNIKKCEHCGTLTAKKFEWASIDHSYQRNLIDWIRLCVSCHRKYDLLNNRKLIDYEKVK